MKLGNNCVSFTGKFVGDFGASKPQASAKLAECDELGNILNKVETTVNHPDALCFKDSNDFVEHTANRIAQNYKNIDGKGLSEVTIFLPGSTVGNKCIKTPNLRDIKGEPLKNIDFSSIPSLLAQRNVPINKNFKLNIFQDSVGIGLSVLKQIGHGDIQLSKATEKMLQPGAKYNVLMTGGGCGIAQIQKIGNQVAVEGYGSNVLTDNGKAVRVSDIGASVKASLSEFAKKFGIKSIKTEVVNSGLGPLILCDNFKTENKPKTQALKAALEKTGKYDIQETEKEISFAVKQNFLQDFKKARLATIKNYSKAIATFMPQCIAKGSNGIIVTGPFAFAIDKCLKDEYKTSLPEQIEQSFKPFDSEEYRDMRKAYNFKIMCDKAKFAVKDNTDCSDLLKYAKTEGSRKNLAIVNMSIYKKALKNAAKVI